MDTQQILDDFAYYEGLPVEALRAASENRQALLPEFMTEIQRDLASGRDDHSDRNPIFFIFHLLGEWREKSAYRTLASLLRTPTKDIDTLLGDAITTTSHRVMAAVFDGDPQPLYDVILDSGTDEFIRSRMLEALAMTTLAGDFGREEAKQFLIRCWDELQPRDDCFVWYGWQSAIALLGLSDLRPLVLRAFAHGEIDLQWLDVRHFEQDLKYAIQHNGRVPDSRLSEYQYFGDTVEELKHWSAFRPKEPVTAALPWSSQSKSDEFVGFLAEWMLRPQTTVNQQRNVGRNDPCPCGSGKKFKKCCLDAPALIE